MGRDHKPVNFSQVVRRHFAKAAHTYHNSAKVQEQIANRLISLYLPHPRKIECLFEMGAGTGILTRLLDSQHTVKHFILNDLCLELLQQIPSLQDPNPEIILGDAEDLDLSGKNIDLFVSSGALQWLSDPLNYLSRVYQSLPSEADIMVATFGPDNLFELRSLTGTGLHYPSLLDYKSYWQSQHPEATISLQEEKIPTLHSSSLEMLKSLRKTGVTALPEREYNSPITRVCDLETLLSNYTHRFSEEQGVRLTYHALYIHIHKV